MVTVVAGRAPVQYKAPRKHVRAQLALPRAGEAITSQGLIGLTNPAARRWTTNLALSPRTADALLMQLQILLAAGEQLDLSSTSLAEAPQYFPSPGVDGEMQSAEPADEAASSQPRLTEPEKESLRQAISYIAVFIETQKSDDVDAGSVSEPIDPAWDGMSVSTTLGETKNEKDSSELEDELLPSWPKQRLRVRWIFAKNELTAPLLPHQIALKVYGEALADVPSS